MADCMKSLDRFVRALRRLPGVGPRQAERFSAYFLRAPQGETEEFINAVAVLSPKRVVYVSCGPDTLARDLVYFKKKGYQATEAWAVDMFPMTSHCEAVVTLERRK